MSARDEVLQAVYEVTAVIFGVGEDTLKEETDFEADLNAKSSNLTMIINKLEDEFDVEIPFLEFKRAKTIGGAADVITELVEE